MIKNYKPGYILVLALISALLIAGCGQKKETVKESELTVNVAQAKVQDIARTQSYAGILRGKNEVYIMPQVPARVTGIYVKPGDPVRAGQTLVTLDSTDFEAGVKQAQAAYDLALASKKANDIQAEAARAAFERTKKLHEAGAVSDQQLEAAQSQYEALISGRAEAGVAQGRAALEAAQTQLGKCTLTSPINGVVGSIGLSLGDMANPQLPAAIVSDTGKLEVEVMASETDASYIQAGSQVEVLVRAVAEKPFSGQVESIATVADPNKHNYAVKVVLDNPEGKIKSGMFAEVKIATVSKEKVLCVPSNAVIPREASTIVFTLDKDKRARPREVKTGIDNGNYVEIVSGLKAGQEVITKGNTLVSDGTLVRVVAGGGK